MSLFTPLVTPLGFVGRSLVVPSLIAVSIMQTGGYATEQDATPRVVHTVQDIERHIDLRALTESFNQAGANFQQGVRDATEISGEIAELRQELAHTDDADPHADIRRENMFARVRGSLTARHQAVQDAIASIDAVQTQLANASAILANITPDSEQSDGQAGQQRQKQVQFHIADLVSRLKQRNQEGAEQKELRLLASQIKMYEHLARIEQTIVENGGHNSIANTCMDLEQLFARLNQQLESGRHKAYIVQRQIVAAMGQVEGAAELNSGLTMVETLLSGLETSLGDDNPLAVPLQSLEEGLVNFDVTEVFAALETRTVQLEQRQDKAFKADDDAPYLDNLVNQYANQ